MNKPILDIKNLSIYGADKCLVSRSNFDVFPGEVVGLFGDSGSGKEMVAKAVHKNSRRKFDPYIIVNCGAIPSGIIESELFGHKKGAYTDARNDRKGYFETANKGTIFLDEIGETPLETQVKLLRVLESGEFMPVGDSKTRKTDVRVVAATNKDLADLVSKGLFRQDLFYRLKTVTINSPKLSERLEDIGLLVERFALEFTRTNDMIYKGFIPEARLRGSLPIRRIVCWESGAASGGIIFPTEFIFCACP